MGGIPPLHITKEKVEICWQKLVTFLKYKHRIYEINNIFFVDTPGFSALDLKLTFEELIKTFKEFSKYKCLYQDCTHNNESGCKVKEALAKGLILPSRYINYIRFLKEINESSSKLYK